MQLLLIRHALPERVEVATAEPDPPLSAVGHVQAAAMADLLADERIDAVWSSPLLRARQTARVVAEPRALPVEVHAGLREFDFGDGLYIPAEDTAHPSVQAMRTRLADQRGDETLLAFQRTVVGAVRDVIAAGEHEQTVAIACHGGVVNAWTASVLGVPDVLFGKIAYTGLSWFTVSRQGRVRLVALNEHPHLRALDRAGTRPVAR